VGVEGERKRKKHGKQEEKPRGNDCDLREGVRGMSGFGVDRWEAWERNREVLIFFEEPKGPRRSKGGTGKRRNQ